SQCDRELIMGKLQAPCPTQGLATPPRPHFGVRKTAERHCQTPAAADETPGRLDELVVRYLREIRACERAIAETSERAADGPFKYRMLIALRSALYQHRRALANLQG